MRKQNVPIREGTMTRVTDLHLGPPDALSGILATLERDGIEAEIREHRYVERHGHRLREIRAFAVWRAGP